MFTGDVERKHELLEAYKRRKHQRDLQAARLGVNADPSILTEIQDLTTIIAQLESEIRDIQKSKALYDTQTSNHKILIIEDAGLTALVTEEILKGLNYRTLVAHDGIEGMRLAIRHQPDLILLDLRLPGMNGYDVLSKIKEMKLPTRVIILTAYMDRAEIVKLIKAGASDYLLKPVNDKELSNAIRRCLVLDATIDLPSSDAQAAEFLSARLDEMKRKETDLKRECAILEDTIGRLETQLGKLLIENEKLLKINSYILSKLNLSRDSPE